MIAENYQTFGDGFEINEPTKTVEIKLNPQQLTLFGAAWAALDGSACCLNARLRRTGRNWTRCAVSRGEGYYPQFISAFVEFHRE